jgi:hypothetical protein
VRKENIRLERLVMPFKQSRIPRFLAFGEHEIKCLLELIRFAVAAALAEWKIYPEPSWHGVPGQA